MGKMKWESWKYKEEKHDKQCRFSRTLNERS